MPQVPAGDITRAGLAWFVVAGGGAFLAILWWHQGSRDASAYASAVVAMMSGVLGYYFGTRGVEQAQRDAMQQAGEKDRATDALQELVVEYERRISELAAVARELSRAVETTDTARGRIKSEASPMEDEDP